MDTTPTVVTTYQDSNAKVATLTTGAGLIMSSTGSVYITMQGTGPNWMVLKVSHNSLNLDWALYTANGFGSANDVVFGESESYIYVGGFVKRPGIDPNKYMSLTRIQDNGSIDWTQVSNQLFGNYYQITRIGYANSNLFACSEFSAGATLQGLYTVFELSATYTVSAVNSFYHGAGGKQYKCKAIYGSDSQNVRVLLYEASTSQMILARIDCTLVIWKIYYT